MSAVEKQLREAHTVVTIVQCGLATAIRNRRTSMLLLAEWQTYLEGALKSVQALRRDKRNDNR